MPHPQNNDSAANSCDSRFPRRGGNAPGNHRVPSQPRRPQIRAARPHPLSEVLAGGWPIVTEWTRLVKPAAERTSARQRAALKQLLTIYYAPICAYIAFYVKHFGPNPHHNPEDLAHRFVESCLLGKKSFRTARRERGSFRNWLKKVLRNFVIREWKVASRLRTLQEGPGFPDSIPDETSESAEAVLDDAWARTVLSRAEARHRALFADMEHSVEYKLIFNYLRSRQDEQRRMEELAEALGVSNGTARTRVTRFRDKFCSLIVEEVCNYVLDQEHLEEEMKTWFAPCWKRIQRARRDT
jgi:DNA-directed RNA polymerase specialized sigma24 family protein